MKYEGADAASAKRVDAFSDVGTEALAILESQMLNYASRSSAILNDDSDTSVHHLAKVYAAGGAARNQSIVNIMSDALGCPVAKAVEYDEVTKAWGEGQTNACSVGVAYKAAWGWTRTQSEKDKNVKFDDFVAQARKRIRARLPEEILNAEGAPDEHGEKVVAVPTDAAEAYSRAIPWWQALEARALKEGKEGVRV